MTKGLFTYLLLFVILFFVQILVCNHILLFGVAMPVIFLYGLLRLPMSLPITAVLTISFFYGGVVDVFSDTAGVNAICCTLLGILRKPIYKLYIGSDSDLQGLIPSISTIGIYTYIKYILTLVVIYFIVSYSLIYFTFINIFDLLCRIFSSAAITVVLFLGIDSLIINRRDKKV